MNTSETNPELGRLILQVVDNQLRDNNPPQTRQTLDRLVRQGYPQEEAKRLIATAVGVEIFHVMKNKESFNLQRFVWNLNQLPAELWDEQGKDRYPGNGGFAA